MDEPETGCLCCETRTCLVVWSSLSSAVSILNMVVGFTVTTNFGSTDFSDGNTVVNLIASIVNILVSLFVLVAALSRNRIMLKIAFWFMVINIILTFILMIVGILFISDVIGDVNYDNGGGAIGLIIVFSLIVMGVQGLLAWTIKRTINEINLTKNTQQPRTYNAYMT